MVLTVATPEWPQVLSGQDLLGYQRKRWPS